MTKAEQIALELEAAQSDVQAMTDYLAKVRRSLVSAEQAWARSQARLQAARAAAGVKPEETR